VVLSAWCARYSLPQTQNHGPDDRSGGHGLASRLWLSEGVQGLPEQGGMRAILAICFEADFAKASE